MKVGTLSWEKALEEFFRMKKNCPYCLKEQVALYRHINFAMDHRCRAQRTTSHVNLKHGDEALVQNLTTITDETVQ